MVYCVLDRSRVQMRAESSVCVYLDVNLQLSSPLIEDPVSVNNDKGCSIIAGNLATNVAVIIEDNSM